MVAPSDKGGAVAGAYSTQKSQRQASLPIQKRPPHESTERPKSRGVAWEGLESGEAEVDVEAFIIWSIRDLVVALFEGLAAEEVGEAIVVPQDREHLSGAVQSGQMVGESAIGRGGKIGPPKGGRRTEREERGEGACMDGGKEGRVSTVRATATPAAAPAATAKAAEEVEVSASSTTAEADTEAREAVVEEGPPPPPVGPVLSGSSRSSLLFWSHSKQ